MHARATTRADLPAVSKISYDAFMDDEMNEFLWPRRKQFLEDYARRLAASARASLVAPATYGCVAVADEQDKARLPGVAPGTVLGFAWWIRKAARKDYQGRRSAIVDEQTAIANEIRSTNHNNTIALSLERGLMAIEDIYGRLVSPDPSACSAADREAGRKGFDTEPMTSQLPGVWYLRLLGAGPQYSRKGVAGTLVEWGLQKSQAEGVPAAMLSSIAAQPVYERYGFRVVNWAELACEKGWDGGAALIWDPWSIWVEALPEGEAKVRGRRITARLKGFIVNTD